MTRIKYSTPIIIILLTIFLIGIYYFIHNKPEWYYMLVTDSSVGFCGGLLAFIITYFFLEKNNKPNDVKIINLDNGSKVNQNQKVRGTYNYIGENQTIRVYILNNDKSEAWLGHKVNINMGKKTWEVLLNIGDDKSKGLENHILVTIENLATNRWENYCRNILNETGWKPFKYPFEDKTVIEQDTIKVTRN